MSGFINSILATGVRSDGARLIVVVPAEGPQMWNRYESHLQLTEHFRSTLILK